MPSGGVCGVLSIMPRICLAAASAPTAPSATFPPPALPRPPAWTWAWTTTSPPRRWAIARAWAGVSATSPPGTGTPNSLRMALPWYSWIFIERSLLAAEAELAQHPHHRVVAVGHALLQRDDAVVGDVDVLRADLGAALGDVAEPDARVVAQEPGAIHGVERVHLERGGLDEEARAREGLLLLLVVADHVADVLAQEALDALVELLPALDVLLHHPVLAVRVRRLEPQRRHLLGLHVVVGDVGDQVPDQGEGPDGGHRDRLPFLGQVHPGHAHEPRLAVDLRAARAALARLAVPAAREVRGLGGLDPVDHVEDHEALAALDLVLLEVARLGAATEDPHREGRHHFFSWRRAFNSRGICASGSRRSSIRSPFCWETRLTVPQVSSVYGWSSRVWPPRLSFRSRAASAQHSETVRSEARSS